MTTTTVLPTRADYDRIFETERAVVYPMVDAFEARLGCRVNRLRLENAAAVLACPLKAHPPNWQHGRVLSALALRYIADRSVVGVPFTFLDIGTAKGFSALCLQWALAGCVGQVWSVDVLDPLARVRRNTLAEVEGYRTIAEILWPWPESRGIHFEQSTGVDWLKRHDGRVQIAFVDGKHSSDVVLKEGKLLADRQQAGDLVLFDDVQIPGVAQALTSLDCYAFEMLTLKPIADRTYAIGVRR